MTLNEYHECSEDWRNRDQMIWATPAVIVTVSVILVGVAFQISDLFVRLGILVAGLVWTSAMIHGLIKHHLYQKGSEEILTGLNSEKQMYRKHKPTQRSSGCINRCLEEGSAYKSLLFSSYFALMILFLLFFFTVSQILIKYQIISC